MGFTIITLNRPFHLFAEDAETRFTFLSAMISIDAIPIKPQLSDLVSPETVDVNQPVRRIKRRFRSKVKIISYKDWPYRNESDSVEVISKRG